MKRLSLLAAILLTAVNLSSGQHLEAGIFLGTSNYFGDLSNNSGSFYLKESKPAAGLLARYNASDFFAARLTFNYGFISGKDSNVKSDPYISDRNLSFRSSIAELSLIGEINFLGYRPYGMYNPFSPYLFAGVAATRFNPKARYLGVWVDLQPLGTEGQGMTKYPDRIHYNRNTVAIPFGVGVKYALNDKLNLGFEIGARRTFTDYLDDVSKTYVPYPELKAVNGDLAAALGNRTGELKGTEPIVVPQDTPRGDTKVADWYFLAGVTLTYNFFDNGLMGSRSRGGKKSGCVF